MKPTPLIAYAQVGKIFAGRGAERVVAVDDVSLDVAEGEFLAIVGGSGSGKTTLLRLANRLIEADRGRITVEGEDVRTLDPVLLRRRIGYVFQSGALFPHISVAGKSASRPSCWAGRRKRFRRGSTSCSNWCGSPSPIATGCRMSSPAASASASAWRARSPRNRASC